MLRLQELQRLLDPLNVQAEEILSLVNKDEHVMALLAGTVNQGLATPTSDIDFLLVYPDEYYVEGLDANSQGKVKRYIPRSGESAFPTERTLIVNRTSVQGYKVQLTLAKASMVRHLQDTVKARNESVRARLAGDSRALHRRGKMLDLPGQLLIHRLYTGLPIHEEESVKQLTERIAYAEFLDNVSMRETAQVQGWLSDIQGLYALSGYSEKSTFIFLYHKVFRHIASLLLASVGELSPQEKLLYRLLNQYADRIGAQWLTEFFTALDQLDRFLAAPPSVFSHFIHSLLSKATTLNAFIRDEIAAWNSEAAYSTFTLTKDKA
jgi:hypothetical protein